LRALQGGEKVVATKQEQPPQDPAACDPQKINGMTLGSATSGFTLVCDFDGNGTFGYQTPSTHVRGNQAAAACGTVCGNPSIDINAEYGKQDAPAATITIAPVAAQPAVAAESKKECPEGTRTAVECKQLGGTVCQKNADGCFMDPGDSVQNEGGYERGQFARLRNNLQNLNIFGAFQNIFNILSSNGGDTTPNPEGNG
jgi:hypothetical protein